LLSIFSLPNRKNLKLGLGQVSGLGSSQPRNQALSTLSWQLCCFDAESLQESRAPKFLKVTRNTSLMNVAPLLPFKSVNLTTAQVSCYQQR